MNAKCLTGALIFAFGFFVTSANAQDEEIKKPSLVQLSPYTKSITKERTALPYQPVLESDVLWSKRVWRIIDLREKINHPLYYPIQRMRNRHSLVQVLIDSIKHGAIRAYATDNSDFTDTLSFKEVAANFGAKGDTVTRESLANPGQMDTIAVAAEWRWSDIKQIMVLEEWFIDKRRSVLDVRIIGLCPIRVYAKTVNEGSDGGDDEETVASEEEDDSNMSKTQLFWVYYPDIRTVLGRTVAFNPQNQGTEYTFDDIFLKRRFSSYIVREANVYDDRRISDYTIGGIPNMLESERITNDILDKEQDMWEY